MPQKTALFLFRIFSVVILLSVLMGFRESVSKVSAGENVWTGVGPQGGTINELVIDPLTPTTLYAGTGYGGVFKSIDNGNTWNAVNNGITYFAISALAMDPTNQLTLYAGTPSTISAGIRYGGVYKTSDGGENWNEISTGLPYNPVEDLMIDPSTPSSLYAAMGDSGVYKSINRGGTWSHYNTGLEDAYIVTLAIDPVTSTTLYAAGWGGVFKSINSGESWNAINTGLPLTWVYSLAIDPKASAVLYAGTREGQLFKSSNGGENWSLLDTGMIDTDILTIALDPLSTNTIYFGTQGRGIFKSTDGGQNWSVINAGLDNVFINALAINPETPTTLYAGSRGGIFRSTNRGENWKPVNNGLPSPTIYTMVIDPLTPTIIYAGTSGGVFKSINGGNSWRAVNTGLAGSNVWTLAIDPVHSDIIYAGAGWASYGQGIFKSLDGGETWTMINTGLSAYPVVDALAIDPIVPSTLYAKTWYGVYKSTNSGGNWTISGTGMPNSYVVYDGQGALAINPDKPNILYVGMDKGIYESTNSGGTWSAINTGLPADTYVFAIAIDPLTSGRLYIGTNHGLFKSTDSGGNWVQIGLKVNGILLGKANVRALAIDPVVPTTLYAEMDGFGVVRSTDRGEEWNILNAGLDNNQVLSLAIHPLKDNILYAGTEKGVYTFENVALPPIVHSITRADADPTNASSASFIVTFSESVTGVNPAAPFNDFVLTSNGVIGASIAAVSGSGASYTVQVNTGTGNGTIRLDVKDDNSIVGASGLPLGGPHLGDGDFKAGEIYTIVRNSIFADVPAGYWSGSYIERLFAAGITAGCNTSPLRYCPREPVTRAQLAVFLLRGKHTAAYLPPTPIGVFQDVPSGYWAIAWIDQLSAEAITYGCSLTPKRYCPNQPVTRAQMAILLLRARHGSGYLPPKATGIFEDVPTSYWAADWIEQLAAEGTTAGCSLTPKRYCPNQPVTRDQMAIFVVRNFHLP